MFIDNIPKCNHSKKYILVEVKEKATSNKSNKLINKLNNIANNIIKVEPLRPIVLPNNNTVNAVINGRNTMIKYNFI
jgi:hypothetical protein